MEVRVAPGESIESALRRFKKATQKAGVLAEARKHEHYEKPSVRRKRNTESQALKPRRERARNVDEAFAVRRPERLEGRHVLLVDDVFTTGSTMLSCAGEMLRAAPGCRISIAALLRSAPGRRLSPCTGRGRAGRPC